MARRQPPVSLVTGANAAARRVLAGISAVNNAPTTATQGVPTYSHSHVHCVFSIPTGAAGDLASMRIWWFDEASQTWVRDTRVGTAPNYTIDLTQAGTVLPNPYWIVFETLGMTRLYLELASITNLSGLATVSAWAAGSSYAYDGV